MVSHAGALAWLGAAYGWLTTNVTTILNGIYVLLTAFIALHTARAAKQSERSAEAALLSAKSSQETSERGEFSFRISRRAYVSFDKVEVLVGPQTGFAPCFKVFLRNAGSTPALNGTLRQCTFFNSNPPTANVLDGILPVTGLVYGPGMAYESMMTHPKPLQNTDVNAINTSAQSFYVVGSFHYYDIFGKEHETTWCFKSVPHYPQAVQFCRDLNSMD